MEGRRSHGLSAVAALALIACSGLGPAASAATEAARLPAPSAVTDLARPPAPLAASDLTRPPSPPRKVTFTKDHHYYSSPWYDGAWQEMIPFGCTNAPYYSRDYTCPRSKPGKHHGIDTFMTCGTELRSAVAGVVVRHPGLGPAYGKYGLTIRAGKFDFVIGHARRVLVTPGQRVRPHQLIARSGKRGAPDGCHLHFEQRPRGGGYTSAVNPLKSLRRSIVRFSDG